MILITGHKGFIGSRLSEYLTDLGYEVVGLDKDITDAELGPIFQKAEFVIHLAAKSGDPDFKLSDFGVNVLGTYNIVKLCEKYGCKLIYTGSISSTSDYGISKFLAEKLVERHTKYRKLKAVTIKLCAIYDQSLQSKTGKSIKDDPKYPVYSREKLIKDIEDLLSEDFKKYKTYYTYNRFYYFMTTKLRGLKKRLYFNPIKK